METSAVATRRALIYCRISQDRGGAGLGIARQEKDARALAARLGWSVLDVVSDNDLSAYAGKRRPGYEQLLAELNDGAADAVIAWHPDRLHRSPRELEDFIDIVERAGAEVATVTAGDLDLSTPAGRMTARIHGAVARHESEHKSERIRRKHLELAQDGKVPGGGRRPFGYERDRVTIRANEAELIREAATRVLAGESLRSIVARWNEAGVRSVTGVPWSPTTVKRLLMSGRISGQREHKGELVTTAVWPGIIAPDQTFRLRALLKDQRRNRAAGVNARKYLLTGLVFCGRCDQRMTTRPSHVRGYRYERYICSADRGGCGRCGIKAEPLENLVVQAVLHLLETPKLTRAIERRRRGSTKSSAADELAEVEARHIEIAEAFARREITTAEWKAARAVLQHEKTKLEASIGKQTVSARALPDADSIRDEWPDLPLERRRLVLDMIVERIAIAPTERSNNRFDGDRVTIIFKA